jgi:signal transduction histidine kinase
VRLVSAIEDALDPFADVLTTKGVETVIGVDRLLRVEVNRSALAIVLSNLIGNAVRYTDRGSVRFNCEDGWLQIEDTGRGIPQDALPQVFERFYQVEPTPAADRTFGIGLSIVKKICDRYRWSIKLDSEPGKGTRVSLRLPRVD